MTIGEYLSEIEYATRKTIDIVWKERIELRKLEAEVTRLERLTQDGYQRAQFVAENFGDNPEDVAMATGMGWETYFGVDKERFTQNSDRERLTDQIIAHSFSAGSASGQLLQQAKQGISIAYGTQPRTSGLPTRCPNGRLIGTQPLKEIIWQGRNQALHWEDGDFGQPVRRCFELLAQEVNPGFGDYSTRNMALDIVEMLGWVDFETLKNDMMMLA